MFLSSRSCHHGQRHGKAHGTTHRHRLADLKEKSFRRLAALLKFSRLFQILWCGGDMSSVSAQTAVYSQRDIKGAME